MESTPAKTLPGLDCGACGFRTCDEFAESLAESPDMIDRCIHLSDDVHGSRLAEERKPEDITQGVAEACGACAARVTCDRATETTARESTTWKDSLDRDFDFYLEHFPEDAGPREIILPHNPMVTREMNVTVGDILIGRPLGMSCGCPITHCGVATAVEPRTGVITWCVTGPLGPRSQGYKDLGYYTAEAYEGIITETRSPLRIGIRYFFQPRMCMLQWRHSGLINYLNRIPQGWQVRLEGLFIG